MGGSAPLSSCQNQLGAKARTSSLPRKAFGDFFVLLLIFIHVNLSGSSHYLQLAVSSSSSLSSSVVLKGRLQQSLPAFVTTGRQQTCFSIPKPTKKRNQTGASEQWMRGISGLKSQRSTCIVRLAGKHKKKKIKHCAYVKKKSYWHWVPMCPLMFPKTQTNTLKTIKAPENLRKGTNPKRPLNHTLSTPTFTQTHTHTHCNSSLPLTSSQLT